MVIINEIRDTFPTEASKSSPLKSAEKRKFSFKVAPRFFRCYCSFYRSTPRCAANTGSKTWDYTAVPVSALKAGRTIAALTTARPHRLP